MIPTAPLRLRNRLAEIILGAVRDPASRRELQRLASEPAALGAWLLDGEVKHAELLRARARRAHEAMSACPPLAAEAAVGEALIVAAALFDAGLHFEVHELLEPYWTRAEGPERQALQGLIQIAVGYQHLANGNLAGARALLAEGSARVRDGGLPGLELGRFADAVAATVPGLTGLSAPAIPRFPRRAGTSDGS